MSESSQSLENTAAEESSFREESSLKSSAPGSINLGIQQPQGTPPLELSRDERQIRIRTAAVIRSARKAGGFNQQELASKLGITQGALSKIEAGLLLPSMVFWFSLCKLVKINASDAFETGLIDRCQTHSLKHGEADGRFKLPTRYASERGSSVRCMMPLILFFKETFGEQSFSEFVRSKRMDPDYFVTLDHLLNIQFSLDIVTFLLSKKILRKRLLRRILEPVANPIAHGLLHHSYDAATSTQDLLRLLMLYSAKYEVNFAYRLENESMNRLELSVRPQEHMRNIEYQNEQLGTFLCDYRKEYLTSFSRYGGRQPIRITETQCHHLGADKCIYRLELEPNGPQVPEQ